MIFSLFLWGESLARSVRIVVVDTVWGPAKRERWAISCQSHRILLQLQLSSNSVACKQGFPLLWASADCKCKKKNFFFVWAWVVFAFPPPFPPPLLWYHLTSISLITQWQKRFFLLRSLSQKAPLLHNGVLCAFKHRRRLFSQRRRQHKKSCLLCGNSRCVESIISQSCLYNCWWFKGKEE